MKSADRRKTKNGSCIIQLLNRKWSEGHWPFNNLSAMEKKFLFDKDWFKRKHRLHSGDVGRTLCTMTICTCSVEEQVQSFWKAGAITSVSPLSLYRLSAIPSWLVHLHHFMTFRCSLEVNYKINCIANKLSLTVIAISKNICFHCKPSAWPAPNYRYPDQYLFHAVF